MKLNRANLAALSILLAVLGVERLGAACRITLRRRGPQRQCLPRPPGRRNGFRPRTRRQSAGFLESRVVARLRADARLPASRAHPRSPGILRIRQDRHPADGIRMGSLPVAGPAPSQFLRHGAMLRTAAANRRRGSLPRPSDFHSPTLRHRIRELRLGRLRALPAGGGHAFPPAHSRARLPRAPARRVRDLRRYPVGADVSQPVRLRLYGGAIDLSAGSHFPAPASRGSRACAAFCGSARLPCCFPPSN